MGRHSFFPVIELAALFAMSVQTLCTLLFACYHRWPGSLMTFYFKVRAPMFASAGNFCRFMRPRNWCAALALSNYLLLALGVPLPIAAPDSSNDQAYPCAQHRCGCGDAEHCWRSCCCLTMAEKLAWAKAHHVQPPDYFLATLAPAPVAPTACCHARHPAPPTQSEATAPLTIAPTTTRTTATTWITLVQASRCQTGTATWLGTPWALAPSAPPPCQSFLIFSERLCLPPQPSIDALTFTPPDPPPRTA